MDPNTTLFTFSPVYKSLPWVAVALCVAGAFVLHRKRASFIARWLKGTLVLIALGLSVSVGPAMLGDRIEISREQYCDQHGLVWSPWRETVRLKNVAKLTVVSKIGREGVPLRSLEFQMKSGESVKLSAGTLFDAHEKEILALLKQYLAE